MTSAACDDVAASPAPASGPAAGARGVRAAAAPRCPAPGSDIEKKRLIFAGRMLLEVSHASHACNLQIKSYKLQVTS